MAGSIRSTSEKSNDRLVVQQPSSPGEGNLAWLARLGAPGGVKLDENGIILLGGSSVASFPSALRSRRCATI